MRGFATRRRKTHLGNSKLRRGNSKAASERRIERAIYGESNDDRVFGRACITPEYCSS